MVLDSVDGESCNCEDDEEHDDDDRDGNVALNHLGGGDRLGLVIGEGLDDQLVVRMGAKRYRGDRCLRTSSVGCEFREMGMKENWKKVSERRR